MNYNKINNLTGWGVFLVALIVYLMTVAPTASFWDCGEFIACSNELEVTHPPGAPFFLLLGRLFALTAFDVTSIAFMVNMISVLASAFTALFTCWTVTMLAKKGLDGYDMDERMKLISGMAAGVVGGLTCTFADSIWFNAVEAEVYALSSFFTAIVVWLMFKWEARADEPDHLRWIILIAYLMGLSIGVHLLNLLTIPALAVIYYFRKFEFSWQGLAATLGISVIILAFIQYGIIQYSFSIAWGFEKFFTGTVTAGLEDQGGLGLPMGTGFSVFMFLAVSILVGLIWFSHQSGRVILNTVMLGTAVIAIGFSSYAVIYIRSNVDSPIDMNNPENILTFLSYMKREQYGDRPLLRGTLYNAQVARDSRGYAVTESEGMKYTLLDGVNKYVEDTEKIKYTFRDKDIVFFPRMYEPGRYNSGPFGYKNFVKRLGDPKDMYDDRPTRMEDFQFFLEYQLNHMYIRYFMWNFVGRESDIQEARWESGLEFGDDSRYTLEKRHNKGKNHYYFLPLLFGLLGLVWHGLNKRDDAFVIGMLFFFTGIAIILYLNQYPLQPRERDYSYAGSFQTFAIWVGMGVLFMTDLLRKMLKNLTPWVAGALVLTAPLIMMAENWDDHTRKGRYIDIEFAKNLLDSCAPNAILFTGGDNDTFPLWYVQEVEGYRTDIRVVNLELLISDWYIDQMKQPKNGADALPISMEKADYVGEKGLVIRNFPSRTIRIPIDKQALIANGTFTPAEAALADSVMEWSFKARGTSNNPYILRKDSVILNLVRNISRNNWERPIYFGNTMQPSNFLNLTEFFRLEGVAYRVVPLKRSERTSNDIYYGTVGQARMLDNLTEKFKYQGLDNPRVNFDEHIRNVIIGNYRNCFFRLCNSYAEDYFKFKEANNSLLTLLDGESELDAAMADSVKTLVAENETRMKNNLNAIHQAVTFSDEKIPHEIVPRNLTQLITLAQLLERTNLYDLAQKEYARLQEHAVEELKDAVNTRVKIDQNNMAMRGCLITIQYLARQKRMDEAEALAAQIETLTGSPIGKSLIEQLK